MTDEKYIDYVYAAFRVLGIHLDRVQTERICDVIKLIEEKEGDCSVEDLVKLLQSWQKQTIG
jgi:hypothetical protein